MPTLSKDDIEKLKKAGWVASDGLPPDLFFSSPGTEAPWNVIPHLHLNYTVQGQLKSLTWKTKEKERWNEEVHIHLLKDEWLPFELESVPESLRAQVEWLKTNLK